MHLLLKIVRCKISIKTKKFYFSFPLCPLLDYWDHGIGTRNSCCHYVVSPNHNDDYVLTFMYKTREFLFLVYKFSVLYFSILNLGIPIFFFFFFVQKQDPHCEIWGYTSHAKHLSMSK